jgi:GTP-binding protein HflX
VGVEDRRGLHVINKIDRLREEERKTLLESNGHGRSNVLTSAMTGEGLEDLLARIDAAMPVDPLVRLHLRMPLADGRHFALVQARGRVLHSEVVDGHFLLEAELPQSAARRLQEFVQD